ncbi:MAG: hypothetical protein WD269_01380 [Acidimicrobiia bacterium]
MISLDEVVVDIQSVASLIGLELALVTLFTSELARRLGEERRREGGSNPDSVRQIKRLSGGLLAVTVLSISALVPLWIKAVNLIAEGNTVIWLFLLTALLLVPLASWQLALVTYRRQ